MLFRSIDKTDHSFQWSPNEQGIEKRHYLLSSGLCSFPSTQHSDYKCLRKIYKTGRKIYSLLYTYLYIHICALLTMVRKDGFWTRPITVQSLMRYRHLLPYRDSVPRFFGFSFFHKTTPLGPNRDVCIFLLFRWVISISKRLRGACDTAELIRNPNVEKKLPTLKNSNNIVIIKIRHFLK